MGQSGTDRSSRRWILAVAIAAGSLTAPQAIREAAAETVYAVTASQKLIHFETETPGTVTTVGQITGMAPGETVLAIDFWHTTTRLYALGSTNRFYLIDTDTAAAQPTTITVPDPSLAGNAVGMAFDPMTNPLGRRLRVVTGAGRRLVDDPHSGLLQTDPPIAEAVSVVAVAFRMFINTPDRDTLFGIDALNNQLVRIGTEDIFDGGASQANGPVTPIGPLGLDVEPDAGLDITLFENRAFATLRTSADTQSTFYQINLTTGAPTSIGVVAAGEPVAAMSVLWRWVRIYGVTTQNELITFHSHGPNILQPVPGGVPVLITGLTNNEVIVAIDLHIRTGVLYALTDQGRLYRINPANAVATPAFGNGQLSVALTGTFFGLDSDPVTARLRITTNSGQSLSVAPDTGAIESSTIPAGLADIAYSNNLYAPTSTTLYAIDPANDRLVRIDTPTGATSTITPVGPLGVDAATLVGFDIAAANGVAYAALTAPAAAASQLYVINLNTGAARLVDTIAGGSPVRALTARSPGVLQVTQSDVNESNGFIGATVTRTLGTDGPVTVRAVFEQNALTPIAATITVDFTSTGTIRDIIDGETQVGATPGAGVIGQLIQDTIPELPENVDVVASNLRFGAGLLFSRMTFRITDGGDPAIGQKPQVDITGPFPPPPVGGSEQYTTDGAFVTFSGTARDPDGQITAMAWVNERGQFGPVSFTPTVTNGQTAFWTAAIPMIAGPMQTIRIIVTDNSGNKEWDSVQVTQASQLQYTLAEGVTGGFFDLDLLLANPNSAPVDVEINYLLPGGSTVTRTRTLAPTSRTTIDVNEDNAVAATEVSTIVKAPAGSPIIVERTMRWGGGGYGMHTEKASDSASLKWYFAEGSQGFFSTYLLLANPNAGANSATVTFFPDGTAPFSKQYALQGFERRTIDMSAVPEIVNLSFGMQVNFTLPGVAERAMYWGTSPFWVGGHESAGVTTPSHEWFLAEGATGPFFETFILITNPNGATTVTATFLPASGPPVQKTYPLPFGARLTLNVEAEDPSLANAAVATKIVAGVPVIVERAQYWPDPAPDWYEAHNSFGVTSPSTKWGLAEGRVGGTDDFQTYILLANPGDTAAQVTIQFLRESGAPFTKVFTVDPQRRFNVSTGPNSEVPELDDERFAAVITSTQPIVVERAMYANANGVIWQAGSNAAAMRLP